MDIAITTPVTPPAVSSIHLISSTYVFDDDAITLQYEERATDGSVIASKMLQLTPAQVTAFLDVQHPGTTLRQSFGAAFMGALSAFYGAVTPAAT